MGHVPSRRDRRRRVGFTSISGPAAQRPVLPGRANSRLMHRSNRPRYSITSSAVLSSVGGTVKGRAPRKHDKTDRRFASYWFDVYHPVIRMTREMDAQLRICA
jgi:hypothetical protein